MQKVRVYWNLHKKVWSVQDVKSGLVCDHLERISLEQAKFVVRKGGQKRVREEGKKNVHAFAEGWVSQEQDEDHTHSWYDITYNPYKNDYFMMGNDEVPRDWVGNIHMDSTYQENGAKPKVYV
jgi:hypothetical protein